MLTNVYLKKKKLNYSVNKYEWNAQLQNLVKNNFFG